MTQLSPVAHQALRLLYESGISDYNEFTLKRQVGEDLGQIDFDASCVEQGHEAESAELRRFDDLDEGFEEPFQRAMEELRQAGLIERSQGGQGKSPRAWIHPSGPHQYDLVRQLLEEGAREVAISRGRRPRLSALAERGDASRQRAGHEAGHGVPQSHDSGDVGRDA